MLLFWRPFGASVWKAVCLEEINLSKKSGEIILWLRVSLVNLSYFYRDYVLKHIICCYKASWYFSNYGNVITYGVIFILCKYYRIYRWKRSHFVDHVGWYQKDLGFSRKLLTKIPLKKVNFDKSRCGWVSVYIYCTINVIFYFIWQQKCLVTYTANILRILNVPECCTG